MIHPDTFSRLRPLPGRCVIRLDPIPEKIGRLFVPETARGMKVNQPLHTGVIVAMTGRRHHEKFKRTGHTEDCAEVVLGVFDENQDETHCDCGYQEPFRIGDRVVLDLTMEDLNKDLIVSVNARIRGVVMER